MKVYQGCLVILLMSTCFITSLEAKKGKNDKVKAEKVKDKVVHKPVKPQPDAPRVKVVEEVTTKEPKVVKVVKTVKQVEKPVIEEEVVEQVIVEEVIETKTFKPRQPIKTLSEYEQCKLECKKKRDQVNAQEYVDQLTEELRLAKEYLAQQEREAANAPPPVIAVPPVEGQHLEDTPHVPKPIIEVTLHQTSKDEL